MKFRPACFLGLLLAFTNVALAESGALRLPKTVQAGAAFSISTTGSGEASLYIVGPAQVLKRSVQLGQEATFEQGELYAAGHYVAFLSQGSSTESGEFDVVPVSTVASLSFFARPSRLPVALPQSVSGVVYVFDSFHNLILAPLPVSFQLGVVGGNPQSTTVQTRKGVAWIKLNSAPKAGAAELRASAQGVSDKRVIQQFAGEPCNLKMTGKPAGQKIALETDPIRDCNGNPVADGTVITFTETYNHSQATVDVPLKRGVARTELPAHEGAVISVATGVALGNEIHVGSAR